MSQVLLPNPDDYARKRYLGEKLTNKEFAKLIADLATGNTATQSRPLNWSEICVEIGAKRDFVYRIRDLAVHLKFLVLDESGIYKKPAIVYENYRSTKNKEEFCKIPQIVTWVEQMQVARYGEPLASMEIRISRIKNMCDTLKIHPSKFLTADSILQILQQGDVLIEKFMKLYKSNNTTVKQRGGVDYNQVRYGFVQARNSFMRAHGIQYPKKYSATSSQSVKPFHGKYSDVKLSDEQINEAEEFIIKNWGLDSDIYRWFFFGIESCARASAIFGCKTNFKKFIFRNAPAYLMQVFESKTKQIKNGIRKKYITRANTLESIRLVSLRSDFLIENRSSDSRKKIGKQLKQVYTELGVEKIHLKKPDDEYGYFITHASHALRHCGCQLWIRRLGYGSMALVAKLGDWQSVNECIDSYGDTPEEQILDEVEKNWR